MAQEKAVLLRHSNEIFQSLAASPATCFMLANELYSRQLITEVRFLSEGRKRVDSPATALCCFVRFLDINLLRIYASIKEPLLAIVLQEVCDQVRHKHGMEAATALLRALESRVSLTPQCLTEILGVLEGSSVTELAVLKMKKALSKSFIAKRRARSSSSTPGKFVSIGLRREHIN